MTSFVIYLIFVVEGLKEFLTGRWHGALLFFFVIGAILCLIWFIINIIMQNDSDYSEKHKELYDKYFNKVKKSTIIILIISFSMSLFSILLPTPKQIAIIYVLPKVINNKEIKEIPTNIAKLANSGIKELIEVIKAEKISEEVKI